MDSEIEQRHRAAQQRIEAERAKRGLGLHAPIRVKARVRSVAPAPVHGNVFQDLVSHVPMYSAEDEARWAAEDAAKERAKKAEEDARRWKLIRGIGLPITQADEQRLFDDTTRATGMVKAVRAWYATDKPIIILAGTVGRGKTMAAADCLVRNYGGIYVPARELERVFAARYGAEVDRQKAILAAFTLVIDDIGRERDAEGMAAALDEVVDQRRKRERTILITNLSRGAFSERYSDPRLHSRLDESAVWCVEKGNDMRRGT